MEQQIRDVYYDNVNRLYECQRLLALEKDKHSALNNHLNTTKARVMRLEKELLEKAKLERELKEIKIS